ncbi:MAG: hypothetical protein U1E35_05850 [Rhodospirillales bacterium]
MSTARWPLALRLARRELRGGLHGFRIFVAVIALGVAAIAAVGSVGGAVERALQRDARIMLGGDVELQLVQRPPSPDEAAWLRRRAMALSEAVEMRAMASPADGRDGRAMVELKAVDAAYPLLGMIEVEGTAGAAPVHALLKEQGGAWGRWPRPDCWRSSGFDRASGCASARRCSRSAAFSPVSRTGWRASSALARG